MRKPWVLNEQTMTATLVVNADLGNYSGALGSAQLLPNGNLAFTSGFIAPNYVGQTIEVLPDGMQTFVQQVNGFEYRGYLMSSLYGSPADILNPGFEDPILATGPTAWMYDPAGSSWSFSGRAGISGNNSALTSGNPNAPQGRQVAFLQKTGTVSQVVNFAIAGAYQITFSAAQRGSNGTSNEMVEAGVGGIRPRPPKPPRRPSATRPSRCLWTARWSAPSPRPAQATPPTRPPPSM